MRLLLAGLFAAAAIVCLALVEAGVPVVGWVAFVAVTGWILLALALAAVTVIIDGHGRGRPPTRGEFFRAWMVTAARMVSVPFTVAFTAGRGRSGR